MPTYGDRFKWTGREYNADTGLQYNRARYYLSATGRWLSEDPIRWEAGDSNLYRYVGNASTRFIDPSGWDGEELGGEEGGGGGDLDVNPVDHGGHSGGNPCHGNVVLDFSVESSGRLHVKHGRDEHITSVAPLLHPSPEELAFFAVTIASRS